MNKNQKNLSREKKVFESGLGQGYEQGFRIVLGKDKK